MYRHLNSSRALHERHTHWIVGFPYHAFQFLNFHMINAYQEATKQNSKKNQNGLRKGAIKKISTERGPHSIDPFQVSCYHSNIRHFGVQPV